MWCITEILFLTMMDGIWAICRRTSENDQMEVQYGLRQKK